MSTHTCHAIGGRDAVATEHGNQYTSISCTGFSFNPVMVYQERLQELQVDQKAGRVQQDEAQTWGDGTLFVEGTYSLRGGRPRKSAWSCVFRTKGRWIQQKFLMCFVGKHGSLAVYDVRQFMPYAVT